MINFIRRHIQKIYLFLALSYTILIPIILMINNKFLFFKDEFMLFPNLIFAITILTIITFIIDVIINKINIFKFIKNNKSCIFLILSFTFLFISCLNSTKVKVSFLGIPYRMGGLISYFSYFFLAILGYKLKDKNKKIFFRSLIYVATIISILSILNTELTSQILPYGYSGIFFNTNHFATYLVYAVVVCIFTFYNDKNIVLNIIDYISFVIMMAMIILNNTFGCYLAVLFFLVINIFFAKNNKLIFKYLIIILAVIVLSLTIRVNGKWELKDNFEDLLIELNLIQGYVDNYQDFSEEENDIYINAFIIYMGSYRGELWYHTMDLIRQKPLLGYGLESLDVEYQKYNMHQGNDMPHNLILHLWACGGLFTLLFYLTTNIWILIQHRKSFYINNSHTLIYFMILTHLFQSMLNNTLFYVTSLYAILFGMIYNKKQIEDN